MKIKRFVTLCLAFLLVFQLTACKSTDPATDSTKGDSKKEDAQKENSQKEDDTKPDSSQDTADSDSAEEWSWPLPEKRELSMWLTWSNDYATTPNDLIAIQKLEEETNVRVKWSTVTVQEATEKFGLMLASGDYPDIIRDAGNYYTGGMVQMVMDGLSYDLTDEVPHYMPNYHALRTSNPSLEKDTITDDGRLVGVYTIASDMGAVRGESVWVGLCLRGDWLEELNLPLPATIDDWYTTLTVFKEQYSCEAPLLVGAANAYDISQSFLTAYGVLGEFYQDKGTVKYGPLEKGYREWVQLFRDWYAEGLIDPDFITNDATFTGTAEYIGTGRAGACSNIWGLTADTYKLQGLTKDESYFLTAVPAPVLNKGDVSQSGFATSNLIKEGIVITKNCKDLELVCRWLDCWYDYDNMMMLSLGIEGETYQKAADGSVTMTEEFNNRIAAGEYPSPQALISTYHLLSNSFGLYNWQMNNILASGNRALEAYEAWDQNHFDLLLPSSMTMTEEEAINFNSAYTAIKTLVQENTIKFITGTQPMENYDVFLQTLYDYGIEACIQYQQAALDRYNAR
ncbi:MAG: extracellular solute-binding protein [Lachnospiraceae bacterium]|nr:extracellular solute-binding protein [Lachnospiraceae bacterium]